MCYPPPPAPSSSPQLGDDPALLGPDTTPDRGQFDDREYSTGGFLQLLGGGLPAIRLASVCLASVM